MEIECATCSRHGGERSNPQAEAREGEAVSRNASELDSASLHQSGTTNPPATVKSGIHGEGTLACSHGVPRGDWRWHAVKEKSRNLRGPSPRKWWRESDGPIVAGKRRNGRGVKGTCCERVGYRGPIRPLDQRSITDCTECGSYILQNVVNTGSSQESRMRENCTFGSMRGSDGIGTALRTRRPSLSTLLR